jgi:hypothetical protein
MRDTDLVIVQPHVLWHGGMSSRAACGKHLANKALKSAALQQWGEGGPLQP